MEDYRNTLDPKNWHKYLPAPPKENAYLKNLFFDRKGLFEQLTVRVGLIRHGPFAGPGSYVEVEDKALRIDVSPSDAAQMLIHSGAALQASYLKSAAANPEFGIDIVHRP